MYRGGEMGTYACVRNSAPTVLRIVPRNGIVNSGARVRTLDCADTAEIYAQDLDSVIDVAREVDSVAGARRVGLCGDALLGSLRLRNW